MASLLLLGAYYPKFGRYPTYDYFMLLSALLLTAYYLARARAPKVSGFLWGGAFLVLLGGAITALSVPSPLTTASATGLLLYLLLVLLSLPRLLLRNRTHIRWAFIALGLSAVGTALFGIGQLTLGLPNLAHTQTWGRALGLTRQPNELGTFCASVEPYLLALLATTSRRYGVERVVWLLASSVAFLGVLISGSLTGSVALIAGVASYFALASNRGRLLTMAAVLVAGSSIFIAAGFLRGHTPSAVQRGVAFVQTSQGRLTLRERLSGYQEALSKIASDPLTGRGFEAEVLNLRKQGQVHNLFLRAMYDGGVFTFLGIAFVLLGVTLDLWSSWRLLARLHGSLARPYLAASTAAFVAFLLASQAGPILYQRSAWFPVAIAIGTAGLVHRTAAETRP